MPPRNKKAPRHKETSVRPRPTSPLPQRQKQTYTCSCTQRCKGRLKQLTRVTYLKHAQFRELDAQQEVHAANSGASIEGVESSGGDNASIIVQVSLVLSSPQTDFLTFRTFLSLQHIHIVKIHLIIRTQILSAPLAYL